MVRIRHGGLVSVQTTDRITTPDGWASCPPISVGVAKVHRRRNTVGELRVPKRGTREASQQCPSRRGAPPAVYEMPKVDNCAFWRVVVLFEIAAPARIWWRSGSHADNCAFWEQNGSNASQLQSYSSMCGLHASRLADGSHCILTRRS